jgi:DMSO/TMAO reductase YedYZ molybdopterin-dependent catalytic subunit
VGLWTRRDFLRLLGVTAGAGLVPPLTGCGSEPLIIDSTYQPTPERPLTPSGQFYVNCNFGLPSGIPSSRAWRLRCDGLFDRPMTLTRADLDRFASVERELTLECIGNSPGGGLISSARFRGVRLRDVLAAAEPSPHAFGLQFRGVDGYASHLPLTAGLADEALLVYGMNGDPLEDLYGAPVRVLFPGRYGMFSTKWLTTITATRQQSAWSTLRGLAVFVDGTLPVRSRFLSLGEGQGFEQGRMIELTGLALTAGTGVARVEVEAEGIWRPAELTFNHLDDEHSPHLWSLWRYRYTPERAGTQLLRVRALDARGRGQPERAEFPYGNGAVHSVRVVVRQ